jgi:hypothetical protein
MHVPAIQSTAVGPVSFSAAGKRRFTSGFFGKSRVNKEVRPRMPETKLSSLRAVSWTSPSAPTILGPATPAFGFSSRNSSRLSKKPSSTTVSGFRNITFSPLEASIPWLQALAKPTFSRLRIRRTGCGISGGTSRSLSTTTTSKSS